MHREDRPSDPPADRSPTQRQYALRGNTPCTVRTARRRRPHAASTTDRRQHPMHREEMRCHDGSTRFQTVPLVQPGPNAVSAIGNIPCVGTRVPGTTTTCAPTGPDRKGRTMTARHDAAKTGTCEGFKAFTVAVTHGERQVDPSEPKIWMESRDGDTGAEAAVQFTSLGPRSNCCRPGTGSCRALCHARAAIRDRTGGHGAPRPAERAADAAPRKRGRDRPPQPWCRASGSPHRHRAREVPIEIDLIVKLTAGRR